MLSLIKIRSKYVLKHKCSFFFSYIFIPSLYLFFLVILLFSGILKHNDYRKDFIDIGQKEFKSYHLSKYNTTTLQYEYLQNNSKIITLLVDNKNDCNSLHNFISKETNISLTCIYDEEDSSNISIVFKHKDDKYKFHLLIYSFKMEYQYMKYLNTEQNAVLFLDDDMIKNVNISDDNDTIKYNEKSADKYLDSLYPIYLQLQSLITKYLINLKNSTLKKNIVIETGINSYPSFKLFTEEVVEEVMELFKILLPLLVSFQFSLHTYFYMVRMIDEKEKKLNIFLERQGISKFIYYLSWFLSYSFINIFPILVLILLFIIFIPTYYSHCFLFLINLILLYVSLFSISYFFSICINSLKTFSSVIKLYNLGSPFLGIILVFSAISKKIKILFSFIPKINL